MFFCRTKFLKQRPRLNLPIQVLVCVLSFGGALPVSIALFPQISEVGVVTLCFITMDRKPHAWLQWLCIDLFC